MSRPRGSGGQAKELTSIEIVRIAQEIVRHPNGTRNLAIFELGLGAGMRIGEICSLNLRDIYDGRSILDEIRLGYERCKSGRSRTVAISNQAREALAVYLSQRIACNFNRTDPVFVCASDRRRLTTKQAMRVLKTAFANAWVSHASSHSMRRTHANALRRNGVDLKIIQSQLGHRSLATTERYLSVDPYELKAAVADLRFE